MPPPRQPSASEIRRELEAILASPPFLNSTRSSRFLRFIVEESLAGRAGRLRSKLRQYYDSASPRPDITIDLPKGGYTPEFRTRPVRRRLTLLLAASALLAVAVVSLGLLAYSSPGRRPTIAVLPFDDLGAGHDSAYLCDGLVEDLTTALARNPGLRVIARGSAASFRRGERLSAIGRALRADRLVKGSVRNAGGRLRIAVQLVDAGDEAVLWSEAYDRSPAGVFDVHLEIAAAVAASLRAPPLRQPEGQSARVAVSARASELYWKGRYARKQAGAGAYTACVEFYQQALALEPRHARAHAALAEAYGTMAFHNIGSPEDLIAKSRAAARRALELDASLAEPQALLAWISFFHDWDWPQAELGFRRAIALNPGYAKAHSWYALGLVSRERFREAIIESRIAQEIDPLSYAANSDLGVILYCARRYDEAIAWARKALGSDQKFTPARMLLGMCYSGLQRYDEAIAEYQRAFSGQDRYAYMLGRLGYAYAASGRHGEARKLIAELDRPRGGGEEETYHVQIALIHAGLRDTAKVNEQLEQACRRREADLNFLLVEPSFDSVRADAAFNGLLRRIGLTAP
ncbi:MAG: hypothetical protein HY858_10640 [Candidatus Solibacter usitatus]|nr:hypothetical protein [Candidatus Solibacter usitatus]